MCLQQILPAVPALSLGRGEQAEVESALKPTVHTDREDFDGLSSFAVAQRLGEVPVSCLSFLGPSPDEKASRKQRTRATTCLSGSEPLRPG